LDLRRLEVLACATILVLVPATVKDRARDADVADTVVAYARNVFIMATPTQSPSSITPGAPAHQLDDRELRAWRGMLRVHATLTKALDAELEAAHGLPLSSYEVLLHLADADGQRMRMSDLADMVILSRSGLTRLVDRLEREGLIARESCPSDARGSYATPAPPTSPASARCSSRTSAPRSRRSSGPRGSASSPESAPRPAPPAASGSVRRFCAGVARGSSSVARTQ
jgi:hypothetical protein